MPKDRPEPKALPFWRPLHPDNPDCKCLEIDQLSLAERIGHEEAADLFRDRNEWNLVAMRCRFEARRPERCYKGEDCEFCHVHPIGKYERDWSCVVPDPTPENPNRTRKLHRHERREKRYTEGPENQRRREYWAGLIKAALAGRSVQRPVRQACGFLQEALFRSEERPQAPGYVEAY